MLWLSCHSIYLSIHSVVDKDSGRLAIINLITGYLKSFVLYLIIYQHYPW
jgi:hypothetical protein